MSINYLQNAEISKLIDNGSVYQKSAQTALRLPSANEIGKQFITYVKDGNSVRQESTNIINADVVIAKNLICIGKDSEGNNIFNEWLIPKATAIKNYGEDVVKSLNTTTFSNHKKKATLKGIILTEEVMKKLGQEGDTLSIKVSWSEEPMFAKVGDLITDGGYSVSQHDMNDYEKLN